MRCDRCLRSWRVGPDWVDRWNRGFETCPGCGVSCEVEDAPRVTVSADDPALDTRSVVRFAWYHTTTHDDWPRRDYDPLATLTPVTIQRMRAMTRPGGAERWEERQRSKALHVGTYEAAIQNMLRRMDDQGDAGKQFYLYRLRLRDDVVTSEGWVPDPVDFVGDVQLNDICPPGTDVAPYLNLNEDPGSISLALGRTAIATVQRIAIPVEAADSHWPRSAEAMLAVAEPERRPAVVRRLVADLGLTLPRSMRGGFESVARVYSTNPERWADYAWGVARLIADPGQTQARLDMSATRNVT